MSQPIYLFSISSHPDTISVNSLNIQLLQPQIDFTKYDFIIATSKQVFKALELYNYSEYSSKKFLCISNATAKSCIDTMCEVLEVGSGYGDDLSRVISNYPKDSKWLYLRAEIVASNFVEKSRKQGFSIDETTLYKSDCSDEIQNVVVSSNATLIFTSPSSVKCFYKTRSIDATHKVIVIGASTKKALPLGIICEVSPNVSIDSCVKLAKSL